MRKLMSERVGASSNKQWVKQYEKKLVQPRMWHQLESKKPGGEICLLFLPRAGHYVNTFLAGEAWS